jgi:hypothetical protein
MAITSRQIIDFLLANPGMSDADIVAAMEQYGVSPAQMAQAVGLKEGEVAARAAAVIPNGQTVTLGDTVVQPVYQVTGSGMDQQVGGLENVITYKATDNRAGGSYTQYTPTGEVEQTGTQQEVKSGLKEFAIGAGLLFGLPSILNAGGAAAGTGALTAAETAALTAQDLAIGGGGLGAFAPLTAAEIAGLTATDLAIGAGTPSAASTAGLLSPAVTSAVAPTVAGMGAGTGLTAAGAGGLGGATGVAGLGGSLGSGLTTAGAAGLGGLTGAAGLGGSLGAGLTTAGGLVGANTLLGGAGLGTTLSGLGAGASLLGTAATGLGANNLANLFSGGLGTAGSLLQMQQSKEAALAAQQRIDAETAAAKQAAQFRPIGMTTRFGTSQFAVDPVTGQLTSAGYTASPGVLEAQNRLVALGNQGLAQAEAAQAQFAPLQTGAQNLFNLGNQYLAQSPEAVAQNYLNQQMSLLQPGRELELANLQNRLQQQGRGGLAVAQGGTLGDTTPELQALFNARAQQEAQLAANAQQYGQQNVLFGAGLLGQGSQAMGQYYGGQQAAYAPYTTALGQFTNLEQLAQQPLQMGATLAQQSAQAGANVGRLGLTGAGQSVALATGADATRNLGAQSLIAAGNPNAMFGQALNKVAGGLFGNTPTTSGFSYGQYGTGVDPSTGEYFGSLFF